MSILNVNKINPVGGGSTITIAGIASVTNNISVGNSVTANAFYGSGANLTGITQTTINSNAANRIITGSGSANTLEGNSNFTYTGSVVTHNNPSGLAKLDVKGSVGGGALGASISLRNTNSANNGKTELQFQDPGSNVYAKIEGTNLTDGSNNGEIRFYTASATQGVTERFKIDQNGYITQPNRPAFSTSAQTSGFSANSLNYLTPSALVNNGNHYNASNGRFTAPIAGTYFFFFSYVGDNGVSAPVMYFYKNGSSSGPGSSCYYTAYQGAYHGILLTLAVNDYVNASARDWNGATPDPWNTYWGGWLLY